MPLRRSILMRPSTENDRKQLSELFKQNFGMDAKKYGALDNLDERYMVAELHTQFTAGNIHKAPEIIGVTGIQKDKNLDSLYHLDWTCMNEDAGATLDMMEELTKRVGLRLAPYGFSDGSVLPCDRLAIDASKIAEGAKINHLGLLNMPIEDELSDKDKLFSPEDRKLIESNMTTSGYLPGIDDEMTQNWYTKEDSAIAIVRFGDLEQSTKDKLNEIYKNDLADGYYHPGYMGGPDSIGDDDMIHITFNVEWGEGMYITDSNDSMYYQKMLVSSASGLDKCWDKIDELNKPLVDKMTARLQSMAEATNEVDTSKAMGPKIP